MFRDKLNSVNVVIDSVSAMYLSKTKKSKCDYCSKEMLDHNLKQHCMQVQGKVKLVKGQKTLTFTPTQEEPPKKR